MQCTQICITILRDQGLGGGPKATILPWTRLLTAKWSCQSPSSSPQATILLIANWSCQNPSSSPQATILYDPRQRWSTSSVWVLRLHTPRQQILATFAAVDMPISWTVLPRVVDVFSSAAK